MADKKVDLTTLNTVWNSLQNTCMEMRHLIEFLPAEMARLGAAGLCSNLIPSLAELL